jgi:pSer/pThr/pTyr-binding forkhead associated (FHA) protein
VSELSVDALLLILQVAFLVLLYLFIWRIVRTASRDIRVPQESFVLTPGGGGGSIGPGALVVAASPTLPRDEEYPLDSAPLTVGRGGENDIELRGDTFASSVHARFEPHADGVWVRDLESTNGTFVNGVRLDGSRKLAPGDVVRIGETDLRYER